MVSAWRLFLCVLVLATAGIGSGVPPALAVQPDEVLSDPELEKRARGLSLGLRCLVCQNQSIDDSDAPLAKDLRVLVRERLVAGDSDAQVIDYVVARYGDFVLLKPPMNVHTLLLWLAPLIALIGALVIVVRGMRSPPEVADGPAAPLSAQEKEALEQLLKPRGQDVPPL
jgi:cytochrome c-type biogenesis protein CcmH